MGRIYLCNDGSSWGGKLPVEERLSAFAVKPNIIVKMQVMSIAVARINLRTLNLYLSVKKKSLNPSTLK